MRAAEVRSFLLGAMFALSWITACGRLDSRQKSVLRESHPFAGDIFCAQAPGDALRGQMYTTRGGRAVLISTFESGHVGRCEFAKRSSRDGKVCIENRGRYSLLDLKTESIDQSFGVDFQSCIKTSRGWDQLDWSPGFVRFIPEKELLRSLKWLPQVDDAEIDQALKSSRTMWYDEESMVFAYQDSFGNPSGPEGLRANRVGYDVGSRSAVPDIRALTEYFEPERFKFPFSIAQGGHDRSSVYVLNFWLPPTGPDGKALPVLWWRNGSHWHWTFPVGTLIGEVLTQRDPESPSDWYVFEIRSRKREIGGWRTNIFRPFGTAGEMADAVKEARVDWPNSDLRDLVNHLENPSTLVPAKLESKPFEKVFPAISGSWDYLPATRDHAMIREFLSRRVFSSTMGKVWKQSDSLKTYAAANKGGFQVVPAGYIGGMFEQTEASCKRCHDQAGRPLGQLDRRTVLYGEIWGEDEVFTWHPFEVVNDMFTVSDGSRVENKRMVSAGLLRNARPSESDPYYRELTRPYPANYKTSR